MIEFKATANKDGFSITIIDDDGSHTMNGILTPYGYKHHFENNDKEYFDAFEDDKIEMYSILYEIVKEIRFTMQTNDTVQHDCWHAYQKEYCVGQDECDEPVFRYKYVHRKCGWKSVVKTNYCANCGCKMDLKAPWEE